MFAVLVCICVCVLYVTLTATHDWSQTWVLTDDSRLNVTKSKRPQTQLWLKPWLVISFFWLEKYAQSVKKKKKLNAILWSPVDFSHKACCVSHKYDERISLLIKHFKSRVVCIHLYLCLLYLLFCGPRFIAATCRSVVYCRTISCSVYNVNHIHGTKNSMKFVGLYKKCVYIFKREDM